MHDPNTSSRLPLIILIGLAVRVAVALSSPAVSRDTCQFVWFAQDLQHAFTDALREHDQHPLYPVMISAAHRITGPLCASDSVLGWQLAAQAVAILAGAAVPAGMYALALLLFDRRTALIAALLAAVLPEAVQFSADGLSDLPHAMLYLLSLVCGIMVLRGKAGWLWAACGVCGGLAYLVRPEGAGALLAVLVTAVVANASVSRRGRVAGVAVAVAFSVAAVAPYVAVTGRLVRKKSIHRLLDFGRETPPADQAARPEPPSPPSADEFGPPVQLASVSLSAPIKAGGVVLLHWVRAARVVYLLLAVMAWIGRPRPPPDPVARRCIGAAWCIHFLVLVALVINFDYWHDLSKRHALLLVLLILPWSAAGARQLIDWLSARARSAAVARAIPAAVICAIVLSTAYWMLRPINAHTEYLVRAGNWIRETRREHPGRIPENGPLLTSENRIAFYADMRLQNWPERSGSIEALAEHIRIFGPALVALDEYRLSRANQNLGREVQERLVDSGILELIHEETGKHDNRPTRLRIYRVASAP